MSIWDVSTFLLSILLTLPFAAAQENRDGLLPPAAEDQSAGVAPIRRALAARDIASAARAAEDLRLRYPSNSEALFWAGYVALAQGQYYDAIRDLRRAEALDPNPFVLKSLAASYYAVHQSRLFLLKMRAAQQKQLDDFAPYYYLGRYFDSELADFSLAADNFQQALARQPGHFRSHYYLGHCYEAMGKLEQAEAEYRWALESTERQGSGTDGLPYQGLARLRLSENRPADALRFAKRAVELAPRDAPSHKLLAKAYLDLGRAADAVAEWETSTELDPTDAAPLYRLYRGYLSLGETEKARSALARYKKVAALYGTN
jgi:tetratricopeptide (TPR) repeat protein